MISCDLPADAAVVAMPVDADDRLPPFEPPEPDPEIMLLKDLDPMLLPAVAAPRSGTPW